AAWYGDVVVLAIPFGQYTAVDASTCVGKPVVDTTNYDPARDGHVVELDEHRRTSSDLVQEHFRGAHVVKAFNTMRADHLRTYGRPPSVIDRYGIPVAADDNDAKRAVCDLVNDIGFDPVDAGTLADGRRLEPGTEVFTADLWADDLAGKLGAPSPRPI